MYPRLTTLMSLIDNCRQQFGEIDTPDHRILTGPIGVGKKTLIKYYVRQTNPPAGFAGGAPLPILHFTIPTPGTLEAILHTMLCSLGRLSFFTYPVPRLADLVGKWLEKRQTQLIIVEDFHHILSIRQKRQLEKTKDHLLKIITDARIPAVFIYPTIERRNLRKLGRVLSGLNTTETVLTNFTWDKENPGSIEEFDYVVRAFEERLAITLLWTERNQNRLLARIYAATGGTMSLLAKLMHMSAYRIQNEENRQISMALLAAIYEDRLFYVKPLKVNPFDPKWRRPKGLR